MNETRFFINEERGDIIEIYGHYFTWSNPDTNERGLEFFHVQQCGYQSLAHFLVERKLKEIFENEK